MTRLPKLIVPTTTLMLAACAGSPPRPSVLGALPAGGTYRIDESAIVAPVLRASVEAKLQRRGLIGSPNGNLLVQIAAVERPGNIRGTPAVTPAPAHLAKSKGRKRQAGLTITVSDVRTGQEVYRGTALMPVSKNPAEDATRLLERTLPDLPETD